MRSLLILFCLALFLSACDALNSGSSSSGSGSALDLNLFPIDKEGSWETRSLVKSLTILKTILYWMKQNMRKHTVTFTAS